FLDQIHVATYSVKPDQLAARNINLKNDADHARILRSVLMKPEHVDWVPHLHETIDELAGKLISYHQ
ncbi:MAG: hypothetical protein WCG32_03215, partial [Actinomycetes bacterium]